MYFIIEYELNNKKIDLNNMTDSNNITCIVEEMDLNKLSKPELLVKCTELGLTKCKSKNKGELIKLIKKSNQGQVELVIEDDPTILQQNTYVNSSEIVENQNNDNDNDNIVILNNDCMVELNKLKDNSIDCVITDPPYFIDKLDNTWSSNEVNNDVKNSHITHLPKGMKFDKSQVKNLYDFYLKLSKLLFQKMKPGAYFLSFSSPRLYHAIAMSCEIAGFEIRDMINWTYTQSMPKGMSVTHIIEKMKLTPEEKVHLIEEYKDYKTPQIRSCFEPICVAMKPIGKLSSSKHNYNRGIY